MTATAFGVFVSGSPPVAVLTPSEITISPGESVAFDASGSTGNNLIYTWHFHDGSSTESGRDLSNLEHTFSSEGIYYITLFVNSSDNGKMDIATSEVIVRNEAPVIVLNKDSFTADEDESITFDASSSYDPDGSIVSYDWDFGDGYGGYGDTVNHAYAKSGTYTVNLTIKDNLGRFSFKDIPVTIQNPAPAADAGGPYTASEGKAAFFDASVSTDNPSDTPGLRYLWSNSHHGKKAMEFYADDGTYHPSVTVRDDDNAADSSATAVNVGNTAPKVAVDGAYIKGNLTLRLAGEKYHNLELWLYESGVFRGYLNVTRDVCGPQEATIENITFNLAENWEVRTLYTPDDDPVNGNQNGASPAWVILEFENGAYRKIHHTFNVRHTETYDWNFTLNPYFFISPSECTRGGNGYGGHGHDGHHDNGTCGDCEHNGNPAVHFSYRLYNAGADDLIVNWSFADSYYEERFNASAFPNFVTAELNYTPEFMGNITVNVTDDDGALTTLNLNITDGMLANLAPSVDAGPKISGVEDSPAVFTGNASDSVGEANLSYTWDFGDGAFLSGKTVEHTYQFSADYPVLLLVSDSHGSEGFDLTRIHIENLPPAADFSYTSRTDEDSPSFLNASLSSDTASDEPYLEYRWDFGDGSVGYGITASHVYSLEGTYTVNLTVMDDDGAAAYSEKTITVNNAAPKAYAGPDLMIYGPATEITFGGTGTDTFSDRSSLTYSWNFGDGGSANGAVAKHTYTSSGTYTVYLTVTDDDGATAGDSLIVNIGVDSDNDSLTNEVEAAKGTNPQKWDSDRDYVADYWEIYDYATDPTKADSDNDGVPDWFEISYMGYNVDTDGDGLKNPWDWDSDGDLISDGKEIDIDPTTDDVRIITNPLVYNDFDDDRTEINQGIECDALGVSDDNMATVVVNYDEASTKVPQVTKIGTLTYSVTSTITTDLTAEVRIKPGDSVIQALRNDPYAYRMYYLDTSANQWKLADYTDVDTEGGYVWGVTGHFSTYAVKSTANVDSDGDGLTDYYEISTHPYMLASENCEKAPEDSGWIAVGGLPAFDLENNGYNSQHSWKASYSSHIKSPEYNFDMYKNSPIYLEFNYRFTHGSSDQALISLSDFIYGLDYGYPSFEPVGDGQWHTASIKLFPNTYPYYDIENNKLTLEFITMHFHFYENGDSFQVDNIRLLRATSPYVADTDGDDLTDGQEVLQYGTSPVLLDTDGDTLSDGVEVNGQVIRYADDNGDGRGYIFHLTPLPTTVVEREFDYHTNPLKQDTDMDGQPDNKDLIPLDYDMDGDGMINSLELVDSNSGNYDARVAECIASDPNLQRNQDGSYIADDDTDGDGILNINDADMDNDGMPDQYEIDHGVANGGWQNPYVFNARYAILIGGGQTYAPENFPAFWIDTKEMYNILVTQYGYHPENVYLLFWNSSRGYKDGVYVDGPADWKVEPENKSIYGADISSSLLTIISISTKNDFVFFDVNSHGGNCNFLVYNTTKNDYDFLWWSNPLPNPPLPRNELKPLVDKILSSITVIVAVHCFSGTMVYGDADGNYSMQGSNRVLISCTNRTEHGYMWKSGDDTHIEFNWNDKNNGFIYALKNIENCSLGRAYDSGVEAAADEDSGVSGIDSSHSKLWIDPALLQRINMQSLTL